MFVMGNGGCVLVFVGFFDELVGDIEIVVVGD